MQQITLRPHNEQQMRLIKQLAKTLDIEATIQKDAPNQEVSKRKRKTKEEALLDRLERSARQVQAHLRGEVTLKSARQVLDEF